MSTHLPPTGTNIDPEIQTKTSASGVASTNAETTVENVSQHLHAIFDENDGLTSIDDTSKHYLTDQLTWLKSQIHDPEKQRKFTEQCELIQSQITQEKFEKIPSELVILLITHEWKRITRLFDLETTSSLSNLAETVISQLEKSLQNTTSPSESINETGQQSYTANGLAYSITSQGDEGILKLGAVKKLNELHYDILKILRDNNYIQQIKFHSETPVQVKRYLMDILSENRPLLGVLRIVPE